MISSTFGKHDEKKQSVPHDLEILPVTLPPVVRIPCQRQDLPCEVLVEPGTRVLRGQPVAVTGGAAVHSPVSGRVKQIAVMDNCEGVPATTVVVENDGLGESVELSKITGINGMTAAEIYERLNAAGIVITFVDGTTFVYGLPSPGAGIHTLLLHGWVGALNGSGGEELPPWFHEVISGLRVLFTLYPEAGLVWHSHPSPTLKTLLSEFPKARTLPGAGNSPDMPVKWAVEEIAGRPLERGASPLAEEILPVTLQQARAIHRALFLGEPYMEQLILVEGNGVRRPGYYQVPLGTDLGEVLISAEVKETELAKVVVGCALNGTSVPRLDLPVGKGVFSILTFCEDEVFHYLDRACIHCGRCYQVCQVKLLPQRIAAYAARQNWEAAKVEGVLLCNECGRCSYVCPAGKPLLQLLRLAKKMLVS
ncbi:MAG TPA: 4Fe-4S dicluster domain-containing protein [Clostridia bacterium]|nr:4Fe-4S dicluster domain-containing protein [Clostridia bacterium]